VSAAGEATPGYPQPLIAIDVVPVSYTRADGWRVATAEREFDPFAGRQALPGVLLAKGETLESAAKRALQTKAGISKIAVRHLAQVGAFDSPDRDPRREAISVAFTAVIDPGASTTAVWGAEPLGLPFDHDRIVGAARVACRQRLWSDLEFTRAMTGDEFSAAEAAALTLAVTGQEPYRTNLARFLESTPGLEQTEHRQHVGRGRPSVVWRWA
jgi:8-oxo-dGTP diphosphatase